MKRSVCAFGLIAVLMSAWASQAQNVSTAPAVNPIGPSDAGPVAAAIKSRIEAMGYGDVMYLSRDRSGVWHAHVMKNEVETAVLVDKGGRITVQSVGGQPAERCNLLYTIASLHVSGGAGANGALSFNMEVTDAGLDCQKGHYDSGIRALEQILGSHGISYPPG
jgi:hypothetical protein